MSELKPKLFALADAIGISLSVEDDGCITGSTKRDIELFEDYSPTIITEVEWGSVDKINQVVVAGGRIWGNLGFVCVVEDREGSMVSFFVIDRSKAPKEIPLEAAHWSRNKLYTYLSTCCKKVYYRSMFDRVWSELDGGAQKLRDYVEYRKQNMPARHAYDSVWGGA